MTQASDEGTLTERTILVTGASSGIGRATALELARRGAHLILLGRDPGRCAEARAEIERETGRSDLVFVQADLSTRKGVEQAATAIDGHCDTIDVLLNNAGVTLTERQLTEDGFERTFAINHYAYFALTGHLLPKLLASPLSETPSRARIVNVSSDAHRFVSGLDFDDLHAVRGYQTFQVYGRSKGANILFTRELARRLEGRGVTANALHPGGIRSNLGGGASGVMSVVGNVVKWFLKPPSEGAKTPVHLAVDDGVAGTTGAYFARCREHTPKAWCLDDDAAARLWEISERETGVAYPI